MIYVYDLIENKNVYTNKGIEEFLGYTAADMKKMGNNLIKTLMHPKDYKTYIEQIVPKYKNLKDKTLTHSYRMKHKDGKWVRLHATEVIYKRDDKGNPTQIVGNITK